MFLWGRCCCLLGAGILWHPSPAGSSCICSGQDEGGLGHKGHQTDSSTWAWLNNTASLEGLGRQAKLKSGSQSIFFPFINVQLVPSGIHLSQVHYTEITFGLVTYRSRFPLTRVPMPHCRKTPLAKTIASMLANSRPLRCPETASCLATGGSRSPWAVILIKFFLRRKSIFPQLPLSLCKPYTWANFNVSLFYL